MKRFFRRLILKWIGLSDKIDQIVELHRKSDELVFSKAKFHDDNGLADEGYNSEQVAKRWNEYTSLNHKMCLLLMELR